MHHPFYGGRVEHLVNFHLQGTSGMLDIPDVLKGRLASHILLTQLPDEGIPEALESLGQMWQFYRMPVSTVPALPQARKSVPARVSGTHVAPVVPVSEE